MISLIFKKSAVKKFLLLIAIVALLTFYVGLRRKEFEKKSIMQKDPTVHVPAWGEDLEEADGYLGEEVVMDGAESARGFFLESRIERDKTVSREVEMLKSISEDPDADDFIKSEALSRLMDLSKDETGSKNAEELICQAGYEDAFISFANGEALVFVKAPFLEVSDVARIADIVMRCLGIGPEEISIAPRGE